MRFELLDNGFIELIDKMGNDLSVVNAARVSFYKKTDEIRERDVKLINYLIKNNHSSPFEMVEFKFHANVPLSVYRQWQRHRTFSYWSLNEVSRRYTSENLMFHVPEKFRMQSDDNKQSSYGEFEDLKNKYFQQIFEDVNNYCYEKYEELLLSNVAREQARMILPQTMYVEFYGKVDLWNLFHFLNLRTHEHAQYEIRVYANAIEEIVKNIVPISYNAWKNHIKTS